MKPVDLSHAIAPDMTVYPGTEPPVFTPGCSIDEAGFLERQIQFFSHTGTHADAPAHLLKGGKTLDELTIEQFYGPGLLLDLRNLQPPVVGLEQLEPFQQQIEAVDFLLLHTGWSRFWGSGQYFAGFPVLSVEAARWLSSLPLKGLGLDTISADSIESVDYPVHKALLQQDIVIIENLTNLDKLPGKGFDFCCFPLSFIEADGSPVRAVALVP